MPIFNGVAPIEFDLAIAKRAFTLSIMFLGMLMFTNLCLVYVEVTFYQVYSLRDKFLR
jgi:hypothetical protein